ncbi:Wzz/FepE/Etk N-terminal domain-containing protein [uncultured Clostridium sp.]|uniref:YveK family protein n=1 Tax=uncultured Clostridium sp. TaxID=59620 RepID=UPI0025FAFE25|nr:Wzz/FepE/Etk N-terminal domain-containing protein [uncultured Clostridium sp.]MDU2290637.1 Wzz/FepE/Etk N-terminal domain-containing protein [Clostridium celatum]MDU4326824.1 Wzz/FepE/Etk N-terminal domain-containing protein [Clostridium celatum]
MEEQVISISEIFEALKKRWILIVSITLVATLISGVLSFFVIKPTYETSTKVFIGKEESNQEGYNTNDIQMYQKLLQTYAETIKTNEVVQAAINSTNNADLTVPAVKGALTVTPVSDTQILQIKYQNKNPEVAKEVLESITNEFVILAKELVPNGNVRVIEAVQLPENPVAPNKKMNVAIAFLLGLMVSVGLVFLIEYLDNTFKSKEELERELDIPVVGIIPEVEEV